LKRLVTYALLLALAVVALYAPTAGFEYIRLDDPDYTFRCAFAKDGLSFANVAEAFRNVRADGIWMPLTRISYMADISLFGPGPAGHHITNIALHVLNTLLAFLLLLRLFKSNNPNNLSSVALAKEDPIIAPGSSLKSVICYPLSVISSLISHLSSLPPRPSTPHAAAASAAALAAALWALHPQRVEAVAWIAARKELLWTAFALAGLLAWHARRYTLGTLACVAACMSKPTAMCFPFLALAVEWLRDGRCPFSSPKSVIRYPLSVISSLSSSKSVIRHPLSVISSSLSSSKSVIRYPLSVISSSLSSSKSVICYLLSVISSLISSLATAALAAYSQTHVEGLATMDLFQASLAWRLLNAVVSVGLFIAQFFVPVGLHVEYRAVPEGWPVGAAAGLAVFALAAYLVYRYRMRGGVLPAVLFFLAALAPTLGIFGSFGDAARADRFFYLPSLALSALVIFFLSRLFSLNTQHSTPNTPPPLFTLKSHISYLISLICYLLSVICYLSSSHLIPAWRNDYTLFSRSVACDPADARAWAHVGSERCARLRDFDGGIEALRTSQSLRPRRDTAAGLAYALATRGKREDLAEIRSLCAWAAADPAADEKGLALEALGRVALAERKWGEGAAYFTAAIRAPKRIYPSDDARLRLAFCLNNGGERALAIKLLEPLTRSSQSRIAGRASEALEQILAVPSPVMLFF